MSDATTIGPAAAAPRRWLRVALFAAAAAGIIGVAASAFAIRHYHQNHYRLQRLRLGMTQHQVESVFGRSADCAALLGAARVLVFLDPALDKRDACGAVAPSYATPAGLPWIYSSVQVVLDRGGRVSAFVHVGESVATVRGPDKSEGTLADLSLASVE